MDASVKRMLIKPRQGLALRLSADKSICLGLMGMFSSIVGLVRGTGCTMRRHDR